jgi:hypothetical protein
MKCDPAFNSSAKAKCIYLNLGQLPLVRHACWKNIFYYSFHIHQNTVNPTPYDSEILIIWYLRKADPRPEVLDLYKSFLNERGRSQEHIQKMPPRVSVHPLLWYFLTPFVSYSSFFSLWRPHETHNRPLTTRNQQLKHTTSDQTAEVQQQQQETNCKNLGQNRYSLIIWNIW